MPAWPDVGIQSYPKFAKSCPNVATFARNFVSKNFENSSNLVTLFKAPNKSTTIFLYKNVKFLR